MKRAVFFLFMAVLTGCATAPPKNPSNLCSIFFEKEDWYASARNAQRRWGIPVPVQMAIINQESSFVDDARPPRYQLLGILPLWRPSSAYGYGQVKDETWEWYRMKTGNGWADRDEFEDVVDFIGWYVHQSYTRLGIAKQDAYSQYLAYHEGQGGFQRKTYLSKPWLLRVAQRVAANAARYRRQLITCQASLERSLASD
ncbi:transglycosylase SLT domain-containing protein [Methylocaldum sp.]|uniref:transglycosylase SLT domain-containing protein n=1 Tax=Methylocaldum sp. TaxID=1969727 RepID=UPI002D2B6858|nr:transglycosylase SLT domain-containing protein [Methylocaldum sp.]HYE34918.1 transglycosylase SLT domain-containing protein [Methylocaldum sp.]